MSRIPFPVCFLLGWITKYSFRQDLEGGNEAASIFVFLTQKLRELGQAHGVEEGIGYPVSQSHVLSLVLKLDQGGWTQRSYSLGYMSQSCKTYSLVANMGYQARLPLPSGQSSIGTLIVLLF